MNGVLAACLMVLSTCVLPTLTDLEKERTRACDADHACLGGYRCVAQLCVTGSATDAGQCTSGDTRTCGSTVGTCRAGTQTCNTSGTFDSCVAAIGPATEVCDGQDNDCDGTIDNKIASTGLCEKTIGVCAGKSRACVTGHVETTCTAASYGADFELAETLCDGKDNDCDGQVDEALPALPCALNAGVCLGASRVCSGGSYPVCSQAVYQAHSAFYEPVEQSCDGKDNDCDGLVDEFAVRLVSDGGAATYRRLALVRQPPGSGNLLELYESDNRIVARLENADGGVTGPRFPSTSVATAVTRAAFPALAANGSLVYESWFEELNGPIYRLVVANAGPTGEALIGGVPAIYPLATQPGGGQALALGVGARLIIAYAHFDSPTAGSSTLKVASCPLALDNTCTFQTIGAGQNPSLFVSNDIAVIAYETSTGLHLARLSVPANGSITIGSNVTFGVGGDHDPLLAGTLANLSLYTVSATSPESLTLRRGDCTGTCALSGFSLTSNLITFDGTPSAFSVDDKVGPALMAWEEGASGARKVMVMKLTALAPVNVSGTLIGHRPIPVPRPGGTSVVYFDTEGATGGIANNVVSRRLCGP